MNGPAIVMLNRGGVLKPQYLPVSASCTGGNAVAVADLNQDGTPDLVWLRGSTLVTLPSGGGARFSAPLADTRSRPELAGLFAPAGPRQLPRFDVNGD